ncbi:DUF3768 domain-containing protein [Sphingomonas sp. LR60]|uniref:DUF3768 domain-containing protein n=1 Tax=Sphingomonas sp. LR60 TaxID=3050233 RepID=UPI002FE0DAEF
MTGKPDTRACDMPAALAPLTLLNDAFRRDPTGGQLFTTAGVISLGDAALLSVLELVHTFDAFTPDNDPNGEHDFGSFHWQGERLFWKIDYYDRSLRLGSPDPLDPSLTIRVLTIMLASEY